MIWTEQPTHSHRPKMALSRRLLRVATVSLLLLVLASAHRPVGGVKTLRNRDTLSNAVAVDATARAEPSPTTGTLHTSGVFPWLSTTAESAPNRSECGHGAMIAWADRLYVISYLSVPYAGNGTGLYEIDEGMSITQVAEHQSVYANRMLHPPTNTVIIGPYVIDAKRNIRVIEDLLHVRIGGMAEHIVDPDNKVYMLGMDGPLWEVDLKTLEATQLFDLVTALNIPISSGEQPHFKAAHTMNGQLYVCSNTFEEADFTRRQSGGRLAAWNGTGTTWNILERTAFVEVTGRHNFGRVVYALGWDDASVILKVKDDGDAAAPSYDENWQTYRLPKASHAWDHLWTTEWPRIREVESERYLMDMHGMFYELAPLGWGGATWGVRPVSQHLRMIPDYASFRGYLVLGGNQVSSIFDNNWVTGQSQSGLWFGITDDLWQFGKPKGWGGPWRNDSVTANIASDPYLMTGFEHKTVHFQVYKTGGQAHTVQFTIEVDFTGLSGHLGEPWNEYATVVVGPSGYAFHTFPAGFSAHWVRFTANASVTASAYLHYT